MQLKLSSLVLASVFFVTDVAGWQDPHNHVWLAPSATDQRSPCPGLNTCACFSLRFHFFHARATLCSLANHGYLPRNGKGITVPDIMNASIGSSTFALYVYALRQSHFYISAAFNLNWDNIIFAAKFGLLSTSDVDHLDTMDLGALSL